MSSFIHDYRQDRRNREIPNYVREDLGSVVRYTPAIAEADGIVCFTDISDSELDGQIQRHVTHFEQLGIGFEWKVYASDQPAALRAKLVDAGFEEGEPEALMVYEVSRFRSPGRSTTDEVDFRRLTDYATLGQLVEMQESVWGRSFPWLLEHLRSMGNNTSFHIAVHQGRFVGSGWIEYPEGSRFAELHGGSVLPEYRRRGIYTRLLELRLLEARQRGVSCVTVDAAPMSKPILEAKGFELMDSTWPMNWHSRPRIT